MKLTQFKQKMEQVHGLDISMYDETFLGKSIEKQIQETQCNSIEDYWNYLEKNYGETRTLCESLHIHFSEFFRDPLTFALLERVIIPELIQKKIANQQKEIRIWSAGCAAGQEAYSIAVLMEEIITNPVLNYRIFATDLDENVLNVARLGHYPVEALKNVSLKRSQTWFTRQGESYIVKASLQKHIDFSNFDLLEEKRSCPPASIFGEFDLVFCCNLLIYYQPDYRNIILDKFIDSLTLGGYLVTGASERVVAIAHSYREIYPQASIFCVNQK